MKRGYVKRGFREGRRLKAAEVKRKRGEVQNGQGRRGLFFAAPEGFAVRQPLPNGAG
jgi:hypothetical protein